MIALTDEIVPPPPPPKPELAFKVEGRGESVILTFFSRGEVHASYSMKRKYARTLALMIAGEAG